MVVTNVILMEMLFHLHILGVVYLKVVAPALGLEMVGFDVMSQTLLLMPLTLVLNNVLMVRNLIL
ncbi:hypothetical protein VCRA2133O162_330004 [Vibrio crassostreae]|nr:hypothetical protein VCRA2118O144_350004 [Vibrio crassostreae]CAK2904453.1 hypothetical protein VCRA2134O163_330013 [Vibrio crassostreae]CAK2907946.1 hypothetical protein VCRA2121O153_330004 [Vibrio crassostreae]CAK3930500.1 hypothetical protein VCRA2133O162_330004 [Vibrio crassostreae]